MIAALAIAIGVAGCAKHVTENASNKLPAAKISRPVAARRQPQLKSKFAWQDWAAGNAVSAFRAVTGVRLSDGMGFSVIDISESKADEKLRSIFSVMI